MEPTEYLNTDIGRKISPRWTDFLLTHFPEKCIYFDAAEFTRRKGYKPCYASCFMVAKGGSFDMEISPYRICVYNGTLQSVMLDHQFAYLDEMSFDHFARQYETAWKKESVWFSNQTDANLVLSGWLPVTETLNKLEDMEILPGEQKRLRSLTGEWYVSKAPGGRIGKFRSVPCAQGEYSWMDDSSYTCSVKDNLYSVQAVA